MPGFERAALAGRSGTLDAVAALNRGIELFADLAIDGHDDSMKPPTARFRLVIQLGDLLFVAAETPKLAFSTPAPSISARSIRRTTPRASGGPAQPRKPAADLGDLLDDNAALSEAEAILRSILVDLIERRTDVGPSSSNFGIVASSCLSVIRGWSRGPLNRAATAQAMLAQVYASLAFTLGHLYRYAEAVDCASRAQHPLSRSVCAGRLLSRLAAYLYLSGRYSESMQAARDSLELVPHAAKVLEVLAGRLTSCPDPKVRNLKEAIRLASRAVELSPTDRDIWRVLGVARYRAGNWGVPSRRSRNP